MLTSCQSPAESWIVLQAHSVGGGFKATATTEIGGMTNTSSNVTPKPNGDAP